MKIACVLGQMFEDSEFKLPYDAFKQAGHEVTVIGLEAGAQLQGSKGRETATVERTFGQVSPEQFDALLIPGGSSPDKLRAHDEAVAFTRSFMDAGKPVFAICHGPQLLLTADTYRQHRMTASKTVLEDLRKVGADVVDEEVVVDRNLVTSRKPDDIPAFIRESLKVIEGVPAARSVKYIASRSRMRKRAGAARSVNEYPFSVAGAAGLPTLDDVGGMGSELKRQIRETVGLLLSGDEILKQLRVEVNGILLYGPPGTGKTMIARATAGEYKMRLLHVSGGEFSAKGRGESEQRIRGAFQTAARSAPCLPFFDELDTMAGKRGDMGGNEQQHRQVVGQLLRSLEEIRKHPRVIVMAATNDIESLDEAIVRSGRFDRRIRVDLPDAEARPAIFAAHLRGLPQAADIDLQALAEETAGRTGADITAIVESAKLNTVDRLRGLTAGVTAQITAADLKKAVADRRGTDSQPLPPLTWDDLILPDDIKGQLQRLAELIADPGVGRDFGLKPAIGALLHGPPGTGKTTIAQVIASETKGSMSFLTVKGSDLKSKFVGESAKKVPDLFARARRSSPTIIFLDEVDALLPRRSGQRDDSASQEQDSVTTEFLVQLDGIESLPGIFVLGATNLPDKLDPAVTRGGRLSHKILIPLPNLENREALFRLHSSELKLAHEIDFAELARLTERLSGGDIEAMCQEAAQIAFQRGEGPRAITDDDFRVVLRQRRVGVEVKSASWDDLILPEETLRQLKTLARLIGDPEAGKALGIRRPTGAVLYGSPGTGKTTIARVLASQTRGDVSFFQAKGSDLISKFIGESGQHVKNLFDQARARTPSIIFVDEIEALLPRRDQFEQSGGEREAVVTEFLQQIDGLDSTPGVFVLGATNLLERVDEAALRGGRLSRHIEIPLPDAESRARLFALFTKEMPLDPDVDVDVLGDQSDGKSGAGIESICHDAAEQAFMRNEGAQSVTAEDFAAVLARRN